MLATSHCPDHYLQRRRIHVPEWVDDHSIRIPWLNFLTSQSIPEETDVSDSSRYCRSDSSSSTSSVEDYYVVLEVQKPHSIIEPTSIVEPDLNFAQIVEDDHRVNYDQVVQSMTIEVPAQDHAIEHQLEETVMIDVGIKAVQQTNSILFHTPQKLDKSILVSDDDFIDMNELSTNAQTIEHDFVSSISDISYSTTRNDSILNGTLTESTFSSLSTEQSTNLVQKQQEISTTMTLKRSFVFDDACTKRYHRVEEHKINPAKTNGASLRSNNLSRTSTFLRRIKDRTRHMKSRYNFSGNEIQSAEPSLLQIRYLDGRPSLMDLHACHSRTLSHSVASQLNLTTKPSYGKRILNHIQTVFRPTSNEESASKRQKTVFGLFS